MQASTRWFGWTLLMLPLHIGEQFIFGLEQLTTMKRLLAHYYGWFTSPDFATVLLVAIVVISVYSLIFGIMLGGRWRAISLSIFSLLSISEAHHITDSAAAMHYLPGLITSIPFCLCGVFMLRSVIRETKSDSVIKLARSASASALGLLLVAGLLNSAAQAQTTQLAPSFVIRHARIFDGSRAIGVGDVWVRNGIISAVGPQLSVPTGTTEIDAMGRTLLPGLIDAHVHTMGERTALESALALGITTEFDMGAAAQFNYLIKQAQAKGESLDLADVRTAGTQPTAPDGHGTEYGHPVPTLSTPSEAQAFVDARIAEGADFIGEIIYDDGSEFGLQIPTLDRETLKAVIEAAHRRGKLAVVHVLSLKAAKDAIAAGADGLVHLFADRPADEEFISLAAEHHAFIIPTLSLFAAMSGASAGPGLARDPRLEPYLASDAIADLNGALPRKTGDLKFTEDAVRGLKQAHVPILAGTDAHNLGTAHGASLLGELQLLVDSGMSPAEALASATSVNAAAFQLDDRGEIAAGKRADLLLVNGDPTANIDDIRNIAFVWKDGVQLNRDAYRAQLDTAKQQEQASRHAAPPAGSESGLISDFETGTQAAKFGVGWIPSSGSLLGGHKPEVQIAVVAGGADNSRYALRINGEIGQGVFGWSGAMFFPGRTPMTPVNLSSKSAITFWARGDGRTYQVMLLSKSKGNSPLMKSFVATPEWRQINMGIADFGTDASDLQALMFAEVALPGPFSFEIDDVRLETTADADGNSVSEANGYLPSDNHAQLNTSTGQGWQLQATSYLWLQGIHGDVAALGHDLGFKASPSDLMTRAKLGVQELVTVQHGRLSLSGDVLWTPIEVHTDESLLNPAPAMLSKAKYNPVILTPEVGFALVNNTHLRAEILAGARFWHLGADFTVSPALGGITISKPMNWVDPIVGARFKVPLTSKLSALTWGDVGGWGAGSQLEYQTVGALSYQLKPKWTLDAGYRYLFSDYSNSLMHSRVAQNGVLVGLTHSFDFHHQ